MTYGPFVLKLAAAVAGGFFCLGVILGLALIRA